MKARVNGYLFLTSSGSIRLMWREISAMFFEGGGDTPMAITFAVLVEIG